MQSRGLQWDPEVAFDGGRDVSAYEQQQQQQQQQVWAGVHVRSGDKIMEAETFAIRECVARCVIVTLSSTPVLL
jgi:hypothetical protein